MSRIPVSENFFLDEFVPPELYNERGARCASLVDIRVFMFAQWLRDKTGKPVTINNWWKGGQYHESGRRMPNTRTGAKWSQHKDGRAGDYKVEGMTPKEVHELILANEAELIEKQWVTTLEDLRDTPTWTHADCRYTGLDKIQIVRA